MRLTFVGASCKRAAARNHTGIVHCVDNDHIGWVNGIGLVAVGALVDISAGESRFITVLQEGPPEDHANVELGAARD